MKLEMKKTVDVKYIHLAVNVRYEEEDMPNDFPGRADDVWIAMIDIENKKVMGWPEGVEAEFSQMKVCDEGTYKLLDENKKIVLSRDGYVPNSLLPGEYGDYLSMKISGDGTIENWNPNANLSDFEEEE